MKKLAIFALIAFFALSGTETHSGNTSTRGGQNSISAYNLNGIVIVDGVKYSTSPDIGAGIAAAYNALPSPGGTIIIPPNPNGGCYTQTSVVAFSTAGKYVLLEGFGPGSTNGSTNISGPVCINYIPTTATKAFTLDWEPTTGQAGFFEQAAGIRDLTLINNNCTSSGGCSSSAEAIAIAVSNGGAQQAEFRNLRVLGFGKAIHVYDTSAGTSWGIKFNGLGIAANTIGYQQDNTEEQISFSNTRFNNNGTAVVFAAGGDISFYAGSFDYNTNGVATTGGMPTLSFFGTHWESNLRALNFIVNNGSYPDVYISGGDAADTASSGTLTTPWFNCNICSASGLRLSSNGRTLSSAFVFNNQAGTDLSVYDATPTPIPPTDVGFVGIRSRVFVQVNQTDSGGNLFAYGGNLNIANLLLSGTAPTISSGFGTSPSIANNNGTASFTINVGMGGTATSGVVGLPTAAHGWDVNCKDITTTSSTVFMTKQTATSTTTATVGNFNTSGAAAAWSASDILSCSATAY